MTKNFHYFQKQPPEVFYKKSILKNFAIHAFLYKQHFYKLHQAENGKKLSKTKQHPETELLLLENYTSSSFMLSSKTSMRYSKNVQKTDVTV